MLFYTLKHLAMKKLLSASGIVLLLMTACNDGGTKETTTTNSTEITGSDTTKVTEASGRAKEISDSTKMLDKKLADPNSKYSPDSLK